MCGRVLVVSVGPITVDGLSTVGPKRLNSPFHVRETPAPATPELACKGIRVSCIEVSPLAVVVRSCFAKIPVLLG